MREILFDRAGMRTCGYDPLTAMTRPLSQRYTRTPAGDVEVVRRFTHDFTDYPFAGAYCCVDDLAAFGRFHLAARSRTDPVSRSVDDMHRARTGLGLDIELGYGRGCYVGPRYGSTPSYGQIGYHTGSWARLTMLDGPPGIGLAWCDSFGHEEIPLAARRRVIERLLGMAGAGAPDWSRTSIPVRTYLPGALAGEYRRRTGRTLVVTERDGQVQVGDGTFSAPVRDAGGGVLVFEDDDDRPRELPWRPHDYADRCCVSFTGGDTAPATHLILNGTAFSRR